MRIAICDDISESTCELKHRIENICAKQDWPLDCRVFTSPVAMLEADLSCVQVVFLDINMPELNGLDAARQLKEKYPDLIVVFVTGFIEYAPAGYHVSAFRYLLKQQLGASLPLVMEEIHRKMCEAEGSISIEQKSGMITLPLKNILYLEGTPNRRVLFHQANSSQALEALGKLADYEQRLSNNGFLKLQKSFIANMSYISKISSYQVVLTDGTVLSASEKYYKQVQANFLQWKGWPYEFAGGRPVQPGSRPDGGKLDAAPGGRLFRAEEIQPLCEYQLSGGGAAGGCGAVCRRAGCGGEADQPDFDLFPVAVSLL